jgi:hypothetical protein
MLHFDTRQIRIIDTPIPDDGSGLIYRENGKFYKVLPEHPTMKPSPQGCRDVEAVQALIQGRKDHTIFIFIPVQDAQQIYNEKIEKVLRRNKKDANNNHGI